MQAYWEAALADQVNIMWSNVWQRQTIKLSPDRKLAEFNLKILHGILPNMSNLHKWKLVPAPLCAVCLVREDTEHMFVSCCCVGGLWNQVSALMSHFNITSRVELSNIILGLSTTASDIYSINLILTIAKLSIFKIWMRYKDDQQRLCTADRVSVFLSELKSRIQMDLIVNESRGNEAWAKLLWLMD